MFAVERSQGILTNPFAEVNHEGIWHLRHTWDNTRPVRGKTATLVSKIEEFGGLEAVEDCLSEGIMQADLVRTSYISEATVKYGAKNDEVPFKASTDFCVVSSDGGFPV